MIHIPSFRTTSRHPIAEEHGELVLYIGFTVFIITVAAYGGLILLTHTQNRAVEVIAAQIEEKQNNFNTSSIEEFILLDTRFKNIGKIITTHPFASNALALIERDTIPQVRFEGFNFTAHLGKIFMKGTVPTYALLARQLIIFEEDASFSSVEFGGLSQSEKGVGFDLTLVIKPETLLQRPVQ